MWTAENHLDPEDLDSDPRTFIKVLTAFPERSLILFFLRRQRDWKKEWNKEKRGNWFNRKCMMKCAVAVLYSLVLGRLERYCHSI